MAFEINKTYNFSTLAPEKLGAVYKNMKVKSILDSAEAGKYSDVYTLHTNLIPVIPNLPNNITDLVFLLLQNNDGEKTVMAINYIDPDSVILVESVNIRVELTDVSSEDVAIITSRFRELGYFNFIVETY